MSGRYDVNWRDTQLTPRFFMFDWRAFFVILLAAMHWAWWTFECALATIIVLWILERRGMSVPSAFRLARVYFVLFFAKTRTVLPRSRIRRYIDYV